MEGGAGRAPHRPWTGGEEGVLRAREGAVAGRVAGCAGWAEGGHLRPHGGRGVGAGLCSAWTPPPPAASSW